MTDEQTKAIDLIRKLKRVNTTGSLILALADENDRLRPALQNLVTKIEAIAAHPGYQGVWALSDAHGIEYMGPDWAVELAAAHAALEGKA